jgi:hypothetical protein
MHPYARLVTVVCTLSVGLGFSGCSQSSVRNWGSGSGSEIRHEDGATVTCTHVWLQCDGRMCLVLAANGCSGSDGEAARSTGQRQTRPGYLLAQDGRKLAWSLSTQDGNRGKVVIDGQEFDLQQGALFLVSAKDKPTRVEQVTIDPSQLQAMATGSFLDHLLELANGDPRVATFLESCKDSE